MQQQSHLPHNIIHYKTIDSVKVEARRLLMMGQRTPVVVTASKMTNAEGRFGKKWHSHSEKNLHKALDSVSNAKNYMKDGRGSLFSKAEEMKKLGANNKKEIN